jgi:hypothetical protein
MKTIDTLVKDIEELLLTKQSYQQEGIDGFAKEFAAQIVSRLAPQKRTGALRLSALGRPDRRSWYDVNTPNSAEPLPVSARFKFLFGDILEELLLFLAAEAGHRVEGRQTQLDLAGIKGHRDAIIDGVLVDVKSASSYSFKKFKEGLKPSEDVFGYLTQQGSYLEASQDDPLLEDKDRFAFLVIDKQLGHICLDIHTKQDLSYKKLAEYKKIVVAGPIPDRCYAPEPDGYTNNTTKQFVTNGNEVLGMQCGYCEFKHSCWPNLRTFITSRGPKYFTKVVKEPKVAEAF